MHAADSRPANRRAPSNQPPRARRGRRWAPWVLGLLTLVAVGRARAEEPPPTGPLPPVPERAVRLSPEADVWVDKESKQVVLEGRIVLSAGPLELFACPQQTKEHESIVAVRTKSYLVHAALLAVGAEAGGTVQYEPEYRPAQGTPIEIDVRWIDDQGQTHTVAAQEWVRDVRTGGAMNTSWVFAGSMFWDNPANGERIYLAEEGDLICVSNFPSATLDVPIPSSQANEALVFEAFTERIPPLQTRVLVVLKPRLAPATRDAAK